MSYPAIVEKSCEIDVKLTLAIPWSVSLFVLAHERTLHIVKMLTTITLRGRVLKRNSESVYTDKIFFKNLAFVNFAATG